jgi:hypothetical protein
MLNEWNVLGLYFYVVGFNKNKNKNKNKKKSFFFISQ